MGFILLARHPTGQHPYWAPRHDRSHLDSKDYEIDFFEANAEKLREAMRPFVTAARKTTPGGTRSIRTRSTSSDPDTAKIRAWAKANGHPVSDRGRIHQHIRDAYYAAQN